MSAVSLVPATRQRLRPRTKTDTSSRLTRTRRVTHCPASPSLSAANIVEHPATSSSPTEPNQQHPQYQPNPTSCYSVSARTPECLLQDIGVYEFAGISIFDHPAHLSTSDFARRARKWLVKLLGGAWIVYLNTHTLGCQSF